MKLTFPVTAILILLSVPNFALQSQAAPPPTLVGQCSDTLVSNEGTRLEVGSGTSIQFTNGINLVSYDTIPATARSRRGDPVKLCLISIPENCPPGDNRGKIYTVTNLRTKKKFSLPDSLHRCGVKS